MTAGVIIYSLEQHFWKRTTRPKEPRHRALTEGTRIQNTIVDELPFPEIHEEYNPNKPKYRYLEEGDRTLEEIMLGRPSNEVLAELSAKRHEDLTGNEPLVLWALTKWYDEHPDYKNG